MSKILTRDDILKISDIQIERVSVPEWGGDILVRSMSGTERDQFEASMVEQRGKNRRYNLQNIRAKLASLTICDESGERLFTEQDVKELGKKNATALQRVLIVAQKLSGITDEDVDELAEEMKNDPFGSLPTD